MNAATRMHSFGARAGAAVVILSIAAGLSACGDKGKEGKAVSRPVVQDVEVVVVHPVPRETMAEALGTVRARTTAAVAPQVMGRLTAVAVSEGSVVAAGALLATIDDTTVRAQLSSAEGAVVEAEAAREEVDGAISQAEAGKSLAEKTFERYGKLLEGKVVTQQEFDEVEMRRTVAVKELERAQQKRAQVSARISQAKGQAAAAKAMFAWTRVIAPFAGVIVEKRADAGSMAVPGVPLFVLEDPRGYRIRDIPPVTEGGNPGPVDPGHRPGGTVPGRDHGGRSRDRPGEPHVHGEGGPSRGPGQVGPVREGALRSGEGNRPGRPETGHHPRGRIRRRVHDRRPGQRGASLDDHRRGGVRRPRGSPL
ncbi:MAG: efflux pump, family, rane fusion lipoprotein, partial [Deltaproteobacteria bacterium]|nr:efflux pump, family, rane fusion lipoprotein [Deltaproteobacteria bacterium]